MVFMKNQRINKDLLTEYSEQEIITKDNLKPVIKYTDSTGKQRVY
jgi:hypothetical protein